jgi:dTDP-L-rhamnose 4-epimerase
VPSLPEGVELIRGSVGDRECADAALAGAEAVVLRFFNVYGPGQALSNPYTGVAAIFSSRLLNQKPPLVFEDGEQSRDFIHVSDIMAGILFALESDTAVGQSLNLGTGRATSINEVAALLADAPGVGLEPERPGSYRTGDIRHCYADPARAQTQLGFTAAVQLADGIAELVEWLASQTAEDRVDAATAELSSRGLARNPPRRVR